MQYHHINRQEAVKRAEMILDNKDPWGHICMDLCDLGFAQDLRVASLVYLTATSRLIDNPIWTIITGASGSGKSKARSEIAKCIPETDLFDVTEMTPQALIRLPGAQGDGVDFTNILFVKDERESKSVDPGYFRSLYEDRYVNKLVASGRSSVMLRLNGCPAFIETTTASRVHDEDQNRRIVLAVNEHPSKMRSIMNLIASKAAGRSTRSNEDIQRIHQQMQSVLPRQSAIDVPFATRIVNMSEENVAGPESLRAFQQLLSVTKTVALLNYRHRRTTDHGAIVATEADYEIAHGLLDPIFRSRALDLPEQSEKLLRVITQNVSKLPINDPRRNGFTRNDMAVWSKLSKTTLERRVNDLVPRDHLISIQSGGRGRKHQYILNTDWESTLNGESIFVPPSDL
tara:strand:- start:12188 stop:13387 length:1200 start_codon:yes stop_codon:yes gene_type:complete